MKVGLITVADGFQVAESGARLRSAANGLQVRNAANSAYEDLGALSLRLGIAADKRISIQFDPPSSPVGGDQWYELDVAANLKYGWAWTWNGTYWLSPDQIFNASTPYNGIANSDGQYFNVRSNLNYFIKSIQSVTYATATQNSSNYWRVSFSRFTATAGTVINNAITTGANATNNYVRSSLTAIATHINVSSTSAVAFAVEYFRTGNPGTLFAGVEIIYQYARP